MKARYDQKIELLMQLHYSRLSEKDKRTYAAIESIKLGYGGISYVSSVLGLTGMSIYKGIRELTDPKDYAPIPAGKQRRAGGGRKKFAHPSDTHQLLLTFIERFKAGSPTDPALYWVSEKPKRIAWLFEQESGIAVSNRSVKILLVQLGYHYRKQAKQLATGTYAQRDRQFNIIFQLVLLMSLKSPLISIDCKKKEQLGNLYRDGKCYATQKVKVYDHDYQHLSQGKVIPHGIYDLQANTGYITIGNSHETADFIFDNLLWWWTQHGIPLYPDANNLLLLCDAGGANSYRHLVFKERMLAFARQTGLSVIVAHYPPYASKYNPIEHRLFCQVHQAMSGAVFSDYSTVKELIEKTSTTTGLTVVVRLNLQEYPTGQKVNKADLDFTRILPHPDIPQLSYRIMP